MDGNLFQQDHKSHRTKVGGPATLAVDLSERIYAVGDVHGRNDLLDAMIEKIGIDAATHSDGRQHRVVFMGDYIDRGDHSREVIERLILLRQHLGAQVEFLLGNHEAALLGFLEDPVKWRSWLDWGGNQTLASYGIALPSTHPTRAELVALRDGLHTTMGSHVAFLKALPRFACSGDIVFVHAGLDPSYSLEEQSDSAMLWGQIEGGQASGLPGCRMVHGHYADYEPVSTERRICVDTGAYYSGRLTAVRLDDGEAFLYVSVSGSIG